MYISKTELNNLCCSIYYIIITFIKHIIMIEFNKLNIIYAY